MWRCDNCGAEFEEPAVEEICMEDYFGVGSLFRDRHYKNITVCPNCRSEDIDEFFDDEDDDYEE